MLDFKELPQDGQAFEQLVREILFAMGLHVTWSGKGADGGRDLLCREVMQGHLGRQSMTWLIQCKHNAHAGKSVGGRDLDNIVDSCLQHGADAYLLACSTQPSSGVVNRLEGIESGANPIRQALCWDGVEIERLLSHPRRWSLAQQFFPQSAGGWKIYATEEPNDFVAHYRGYVFHITNRINSYAEMHLGSIEKRIDEIEAIDLPKGHFIRPRCVWYNGKSPEYIWYVDYMRPIHEKPAVSRAKIKYLLKGGWALEDGQCYTWDVKMLEYHPHSDHFDEDHYDYYTRYIPNFLAGRRREAESDWREYYEDSQRMGELEAEAAKIIDKDLERLRDTFDSLPFIRVMRVRNALVEHLHKFSRRYNWEDILTDVGFASGSFFAVKFVLQVSDAEKMKELFATMPLDFGRTFRLSRALVFTPNTGLSDDDDIYDLSISCMPAAVCNQWDYRLEINSYLTDIADAIDAFRLR
jgi:hypothetical protein